MHIIESDTFNAIQTQEGWPPECIYLSTVAKIRREIKLWHEMSLNILMRMYVPLPQLLEGIQFEQRRDKPVGDISPLPIPYISGQ